MKFIYFNFEYAVKEHDYIIEKSGGLTGVKELGQLNAT
jgi:death on curing protein